MKIITPKGLADPKGYNNGRLVGSAGTITQTSTTSRQIQFGLKYVF